MIPWRLRGDDLAARGDRTALLGRGSVGAMSYAVLAERAAAVWRPLRRAGVLRGDRVAIVSNGRGHDEPVALAGVLTSGAVAVPLDATAPPGRLRAMVNARGCRAVVHDEAARGWVEGEVGAGLAGVVLDGSGEMVATWDRTADRDPREQDHDGAGSGTDAGGAREGAWDAVACVLHTSGSTGTPKPVPITWAGLDAFTAWTTDLVGLEPGDRVLRVAELLFDLAWFDHLATWRAGATLLTMARRDLASGRALRDALAELAPTIVYGVPSLFMKLVAAGGELPHVPRAIFFAGEVFPPDELRALAERAPGTDLYNFYGPTETNVCTYHHVRREELDREIPIGLACPYARCWLVNDDGTTIVEGAGTGELVVEGPTTVGGGPYATRDRVERKTDGLLYFRGRIDRMVKVRGYRVEPGEVEAALATHPDVRQAAVIPHDDARLGKTLRAFVTMRSGAAAGERELRMHLAERLPPYMIPDRVFAVGELPRTPTGKIDYAALREPA